MDLDFKFICDFAIVVAGGLFIAQLLKKINQQRDEILQLKAELAEADIHRAYNLPSPAQLENLRLRNEATAP